MKNLINILFLFLFMSSYSQNGALIIKDNGNVIMKDNVNLIINQTNTQGIQKTGNLQGGIICDNEQSRVIWKISTSTGNYIVPFKILNTLIPFAINISVPGIGTGKVLMSTYHTSIDNTPYPNGNGYFSPVTNTDYNGSDNSNNAVDRFWMINYDGFITIPTSQFTMTYDVANDLNGIIPNDLQAQYWTGTQWNLPTDGVSNVPNNNVELIPHVSQNAPWVLSNKNMPLPITVDPESFQIICESDYRIIRWATESEYHSNYVIVQSSVDNNMFFNNVDTLQSMGDYNSRTNYFIVDNNYYDEQEIHYRLYEVNIDGNPILYYLGNSYCLISSDDINIYPNPGKVNEEIVISGDVYSIAIYDILGRIVNAQIIDNKVFGLSSGIYFFVINNTFKTKIIIN